MLPPSHVSYTWLTLSLAQEHLGVAPDVDYRLAALAAMGPDIIDKPLAWTWFFDRFKTTSLFAHMLLFHLVVLYLTARRYPLRSIADLSPSTLDGQGTEDEKTLEQETVVQAVEQVNHDVADNNAASKKANVWVYALAFVGHVGLDRLWNFRETFFWPLNGFRFTTWKKQGSEQQSILKAYWYAFTGRPELWGWEVGGLLALSWFVWRHELYLPRRLLHFILTGRVKREKMPR